MPAYPESRSPFSPVTLYASPREPRLRLAILAAFAPFLITLFMVAEAPPEWWPDAFGAQQWAWVLAGLLGFSAALPWLVSRWHDRYVLRLERTPDGRWVLTTLILWGLRTRELAAEDFVRAGQRISMRGGPALIFDRRGELPLGWDEIVQSLESRAVAG